MLKGQIHKREEMQHGRSLQPRLAAGRDLSPLAMGEAVNFRRDESVEKLGVLAGRSRKGRQ